MASVSVSVSAAVCTTLYNSVEPKVIGLGLSVPVSVSVHHIAVHPKEASNETSIQKYIFLLTSQQKNEGE